MSSTENRIVQMQFNNREFEQGVSDTLKSIDSLNKSLENMGKDIDKNGVKFALVEVSDAVGEAGNKFSMLEEIATGVLRRIGERIADVGLQLVNELTFENIAEGYNKYESEIEKTAGLINAAKFQGYEDPEAMVTESLARIQWFADSTSYSYNSMVSAFLAFVNADVPMEKAIDLIMGMGSAFSDAGAVATEVGGAFNVLAKSVGKGSMVYKMALNQLQNTYKVLSPQTIQSYMDAAEYLGYLQKAEEGYITTNKAFNEGISKQKGGQRVSRANMNTITGWLNGEVLQKVYEDYGAYARAVYEVQDELYNASGAVVTLSDAMDEVDKRMADGKLAISELSREAFLSAQEATTYQIAIDAVKDGISSLWKTIFTNVIGDYTESKKLFTDIQDYLLVLFGTPIESLKNVLTEWKASGGRTALLEAFANIVKALENLIKPINQAFRELFPRATAQQLLDLTTRFKEFTEKLILSEESMETIRNISGIIFRSFKLVVGVIGAAFSILQNFLEITKPIRDVFATVFNIMAKGVTKIFDTVESFDVLGNMAKQVTYLWTSLKNKLKEFWQTFTDGKTVISILDDVYGGMKTFTIDMEGLQGIWGFIKGKVVDTYNTIVATILPVWDDLKERVTTSIDAIKKWFDELNAKISDFKGNVDENIINPVKKAFVTVENFVGAIIGGLVGFIKKLFESLGEVINGSTTMFDKAKKRMGDGNDFIGGLRAVVNFIIGVLAKVNIVKILESISKAMEGLKSVPKVLKGMEDTFKQLGKTIKTFQKQVKANVLKSIAGSILMLAGAMLVFSLIDEEKATGAFMAIALLVGEMAGVLAAIGKMQGSAVKISKKGVSTSGGLETFAIALITFGTAIVLIAAAIKSLASIEDPKRLQSAGIAIAIVMGALLGFMAVATLLSKNLTPKKISSFNGFGLMMLKLASGILIIANAIKVIGILKPEEFSQGMIGFVTILGGISAAFAIMGFVIESAKLTPAKIEAFGKALVMASVAVALMSGALAILSKADPKGLLVGAGTLVGIMLLFAVAAEIAKDSTTVIAFAGAFAILGAALGMLAVGLLALGLIPYKQLAQGVLLLAGLIGMMTTVAAFLKGDSAVGLLSLAATMLILGPACIKLALGLTALGLVPFKVIAKGLGALVVVLGALVIASFFLTEFSWGLISLGIAAIGVGLGVMLAAKGLTMLIALLEVIRVLSGSGVIEQAFYGIGAAAAAIFFGFIETVIEHIPTLIADILAGIDLIIVSIFDFIESEGGKKLFAIVDSIIAFLPKLIAKIMEVLLKLVGNLLVEVSLAILTGITGMSEEEAKAARESAHEFINGFAKGITEYIKKGLDAIVGFGKSILSSLKEVLGIHSPSVEAEGIGDNVVAGFVNGIKDKASDAVTSMKDLGKDSLSSLKDGLLGGLNNGALLDTIGLDSEVPITPVLDLSQIESGKGELADMLNDVSSTAIGTGITDPYNFDMDALSQLGSINSQFGSLNASNPYSSDTFANYIKSALNGVGVYADGKKIGKLVDVYRANTSRAGGY